MQRFPALIGGERFDPSDQSDDNPAWVHALERQHLKNTAFCLCLDGARPPLVIRLYSRTTAARHYGLARLADTGLDHHPDCLFFGEASEIDQDKDSLPAFDQRADGSIRAHLAFSLGLSAPAQESEARTRPGAAARERHAGRARASEAATLLRLWREARLNVYHGAGRSWFKAAYALLRAARQFVVSRDGVRLADYLLIASAPSDRMASQHNQEVLARAAAAPSRLLVVGRMRPYTSDKARTLLPIADYSTLPKVLAPKAALDDLLQRRPLIRNLVDQRLGNAILLACIEPAGGDWWKLHSMGALPTSPRFLPVESMYELEFEDYLVQHGRTFIKPIAIAELGTEDMRPDYILLDTVPRTRCEVWGMQTPEYLAGKAARIAMYANKGQSLLSWSADPREPLPALPPISVTKDR